MQMAHHVEIFFDSADSSGSQDQAGCWSAGETAGTFPEHVTAAAQHTRLAKRHAAVGNRIAAYAHEEAARAHLAAANALAAENPKAFATTNANIMSQHANHASGTVRVPLAPEPALLPRSGEPFAERAGGLDPASRELRDAASKRSAERKITFGEALRELRSEDWRPSSGKALQVFAERTGTVDPASVELRDAARARVRESGGALAFGEALKQLRSEGWG